MRWWTTGGGSIDYQVENFRCWSALAKLELFLYNEICFDTLAVATHLATQIGVAVDPRKVLAPFRSRGLIGQFNKGAALRYQEMPAEQQTAFLDRYADLYRAFRFDTPAAEAVAGRRSCGRRGPAVICAHRSLTLGAGCGLDGKGTPDGRRDLC